MNRIIFLIFIVFVMISCDSPHEQPTSIIEKKLYRVYIYPDELQHLILVDSGVEKYYTVIGAEAPDNTTLILEVHQEDN